MDLREALTVNVRLATIAHLVTSGKHAHPELSSRLESAVLILTFREIRAKAPRVWLVQSDDPRRYYQVLEPVPGGSAGACDCPDNQKAPRAWCKHRLALALAKRAAELEQAQAREQLERGRRSPGEISLAIARGARAS